LAFHLGWKIVVVYGMESQPTMHPETPPPDPSPALERTLARAIDAEALLQPGRRVLVGVSGGADSVALLHGLCALAGQVNRRYELIVAHLDHALRTESAEDARFVANLADRLGLECILARADVAARARQDGQGTEHAARMERYEFFARSTARCEASAVALAHHADDNVETILFRILRGTGLRGLAGMQAKRELPSSGGAVLVRPMLHLRRAEILDYCHAVKLSWREDHTNADSAYRRNFLRQELLPLVRRRVNDQADEAILRLAGHARLAEAYLTRQAEMLLAKSVAHEDAERILLDAAVLAPSGPDPAEAILRTTAYRITLERLGLGERNLTAEHLAAVDSLLDSVGGAVNLPQGFYARRERGHLLFVRPSDSQAK